MEHARGDAAEGDALHAMLRGELQAGAVARGEQALVLRRDAPVHDRADGVENIVTGEVIRPRDLRPPGRLGAALRRHDLRAVAPQLHTRVGVDAVVNAGVTGDVAARHAGVRGVDDGPALQAGDVALPEIEGAAKRAQVTQTDDAARVELPAQIVVPHRQKRLIRRHGHTDVHQAAQPEAHSRLHGRLGDGLSAQKRWRGMRSMRPDRDVRVQRIRVPTEHGGMPALVLSPPAAPARLEDFSGLPPAYSFVGDGEPFYAETVHYFERLRAAGVPAQLDVYHCDMHAFDMMRPQDARSVEAAETFNRQFAYARAHYFTPQREADDGEGRVR